jgi:hypothetical protein
MYGVKALNDESFVTGFIKKWGAKKSDFCHNMNARTVIDSHSTLNKVD